MVKVVIGIALSAIILSSLDILGWNLFFSFNSPIYDDSLIRSISYWGHFYLFLNNLLVISILTWMIYQVMPLLDKYRKRTLFIFILGVAFSLYSKGVVLASNLSLSWIVLEVLFNSFEWLIVSLILAQFIRPKHLGAS